LQGRQKSIRESRARSHREIKIILGGQDQVEKAEQDCKVISKFEGKLEDPKVRMSGDVKFQ
jgi:hypothetical protein